MSDAFDAKASQGLARKDRRCVDAFTGTTACERFALVIASDLDPIQSNTANGPELKFHDR